METLLAPMTDPVLRDPIARAAAMAVAVAARDERRAQQCADVRTCDPEAKDANDALVRMLPATANMLRRAVPPLYLPWFDAALSDLWLRAKHGKKPLHAPVSTVRGIARRLFWAERSGTVAREVDGRGGFILTGTEEPEATMARPVADRWATPVLMRALLASLPEGRRAAAVSAIRKRTAPRAPSRLNATGPVYRLRDDVRRLATAKAALTRRVRGGGRANGVRLTQSEARALHQLAVNCGFFDGRPRGRGRVELPGDAPPPSVATVRRLIREAR